MSKPVYKLLDSKGRVLIPREVRSATGMEYGDILALELVDGKVQVRKVELIENYPGFPEGSTGLGLMELFHKQAKKFGVMFKLTDVRAVQLKGDKKVVETFRTDYECRSVIIASGGKPRLTGGGGQILIRQGHFFLRHL